MSNDDKPKTIAEMNAKELLAHIQEVDAKHKQKMKHLRALLRVIESQGTE